MKTHKTKGIPSTPKPCRVVDSVGNTYHPTSAPAGLFKCGVMLELKPKKKDYIFPSHLRAIHARDHTIRYLVDSGLPVDPANFIIEEVKP